MIKLKQITLALLMISIITSCDFIGITFKSKDTTRKLVESLINGDYDNSLNYLALKHESTKDVNIDTVKLILEKFKNVVIENFGTELDYTFMKSEKTYSTVEKEKTIPNTTVVLIQISNNEEFGVLKVFFDDETKNILGINLLDVKKPIPNMTLFWLFGLLALCIPAFNIYIIILIKRSDLKMKWLKYIAVIFLNVPAITYSAVDGLSVGLLSFQVLLGVSFNYMGYLNAAWAFGIPLGGLYWLWSLKIRKSKKIKMIVETENIAENLTKNEINE